MITKHAIILAFVVLVTIGLTVTNSFSQTSTTGTVDGTVTDQAGAVVPAITVTLSGPNSLRPQTTTTDQNGYYRFSSVPPGLYTVDIAAAKGFSAYKQDNVEVNLSRGSTV